MAPDIVATAHPLSQMIQDLEVLPGPCTNLSYDIISILDPFVGSDGLARRGETGIENVREERHLSCFHWL